jgi:putative hydrolase of the HAD superfamily
MAIRALAVDLGGVMLLPDPSLDQAWVARQLQLPTKVVQRDLWYGIDVEAANRGQITAEEYARRAAHRLGIPANRVLAVVEKLFTGSLNRPLALWLAGLRPQLRIVAFTNNWSFAGRILSSHRIHGLFDQIVNSAETGCCKPEPGMYMALLKKLGLRADQVMVLDDQRANIEAAEALGFLAVEYTTLEACVLAFETVVERGQSE